MQGLTFLLKLGAYNTTDIDIASEISEVMMCVCGLLGPQVPFLVLQLMVYSTQTNVYLLHTKTGCS